MTFVDDRTGHQRKTHSVIILGTDSFLSGWGEAKGGSSYAGWACKPEDQYEVERWVRRRGDMKRVRVVESDYKPQGGKHGHCHIYVVENGHPALS